MTAQIRHDEAVLAPRWMTWVGLALATLTGLVAVSTLRDASVPLAERLWAAAPVLVAGFAIGLIGLAFSRLHVHAGPEGVRAGFGPFASTIQPEAIESATAEHYRWLRFGGWGLRWSWNMRDRAYSVPFVREGVTIRLHGGRTVFLSSRQPEHLAAAVDGLAGHRNDVSAL